MVRLTDFVPTSSASTRLPSPQCVQTPSTPNKALGNSVPVVKKEESPVRLTDYVPKSGASANMPPPQPKYTVPPRGMRPSKGKNPTANIRLPPKEDDWTKAPSSASVAVPGMKPVKLEPVSDKAPCAIVIKRLWAAAIKVKIGFPPFNFF